LQKSIESDILNNMVDISTEIQGSKNSRLDDIMGRIERHSNDEQNGAVSLFKDVPKPNPEDPEKQAQYAANTVYDGMMITLSEIAAYAVRRAKKNDPLAKDYEAVARAVEPMTHIARALADDQVPLERNIWLEERQREAKDTVYAYRARNFTLDGKDYKEVRVFIRPHRYEQPIEIRQSARKRPQISETTQSRMTIDILPADVMESAVSIRVDREDMLRDFEITYDIEIGNGDVNLMDYLDFSKSGASQINPGQRKGHHFSSMLKAEEFNVTFSDILQATNTKFAGIADKAGPSSTPPTTPK